ncbi:cell envelope integrity protein CreD [Piscinibacter sp. XHJ-5]|uniref:cell envelope integrity protein CreD n=1 Tax=Piscinibacter sp. XHJ-5 TaxID=3037797 RepID=UPI002453366E|nr:cell envelope integrity protein CreD [Piscinibacter sp. XHJ-5]
MKIHPVVPKLLAVIGIVGLLTLALARVSALVEERHERLREAERSVEQSQAGRQALAGPVLVSHCTEQWDSVVGDGADRKSLAASREFMLTAAPSRLAVQADASLEPRWRGLFKVNTYAGKATVQAHWNSLAALSPKGEHAGSRVACAAPVLMVALSDARGIRHARITAAGQALAVRSGTRHPSHPRGFHAVLPELPRNADAPFSAELALELVGTAALGFAPVADDTRVQLTANWPHPSFGGRFLPVTREVRHDGFSATWQVSSLATTAPDDFARRALLCAPHGSTPDMQAGASRDRRALRPETKGVGTAGCIEAFDVAFIDPVNPYSLSDRAIKYGLLFIGLTFAAVGMIEVLRQLRVHPVQYLLVGCALSIFFLLLLALSEHLPFGESYAIAAAACVALLAFYARHLLGGWRAGLAFGGGVAALYGALYLLLQLEQTALILGAVLLFAVLAGVMVATRRIDWYGLTRSEPAGAPLHNRAS